MVLVPTSCQPRSAPHLTTTSLTQLDITTPHVASHRHPHTRPRRHRRSTNDLVKRLSQRLYQYTIRRTTQEKADTMPGSICSMSTLEAPSVRYPWFDEKSEQDVCQRQERILCPDGAPAEFDQPGIPKQNVSPSSSPLSFPPSPDPFLSSLTTSSLASAPHSHALSVRELPSFASKLVANPSASSATRRPSACSPGAAACSSSPAARSTCRACRPSPPQPRHSSSSAASLKPFARGGKCPSETRTWRPCSACSAPSL